MNRTGYQPCVVEAGYEMY